ncbi:hypothetical protein SAMN04244559_02634 [Magnetospirillum fulvum]|uniref:Uncharacterized protein n=1 Tax=Magnetospirillum fulvum TaxID=1082 RepID=A0A1H6IKX4_MAGFU|nr:hypothetical protein SAMN04244559_02634 [Magnetospirillum fulvum]
MAGAWKIRKYDGLDQKGEWSISGALSEDEVCTLLQRLVSQNLSEDEIIGASLRRNDPRYFTLLERIGKGSPISFGHGVHYTAQFEKT